MRRPARLAATFGTVFLVAFGLGGYTALDAERSGKMSPAPVAHVAQPAQPTETRIINKTVTHTVEVTKLSSDCRMLLDRTFEMYQAVYAFNIDKADLQYVLDTVSSAMVLDDKKELNKAHERMTKIETAIGPSLRAIATTKYAAEGYRDRCQS